MSPTFTVMVVCSANVCRSPLATALLRDRLGATSSVQVLDCGVAAHPGAPVCSDTVRWAEARGRLPADLLDRLTGHRATPLCRDSLDGAGLVLAADRGCRAAVRSLHPGISARTFTLREAASLAECLAGCLAQGVDPCPSDLDDVVARLHRARGHADLVPPVRVRADGRPWRKVTVAGHDVPDAHHGRGMVPHRAMRRCLEPAVETIAGLLAAADRPR